MGKWAWHILALLFFAWVFGITTNFALNDPDLWWHLKTGQHTLETRSLPNSDPFSYTSPNPLPKNEKQGLKAEWLGQVMFYSAYMLDGYEGVGFFRGLLIVLPMFFIYVWLVKKGLKPWMALASSAFGALLTAIMLFYTYERPQGISFLISIIALILLEGIRRKNRVSAVLLAFLMAFWANVHAGFIVGIVIILLYVFGETAKWGYQRLRGAAVKPNYLLFWGALAAILASGLNPNGFTLSYNYLFGLASRFFTDIQHSVGLRTGGQWVENVVLEFRPLIYFYKQLYYHWLLFYWAFTALLLILLAVKYWMKKDMDLPELFTVIFVSFFANYYARGLMFSIVVLSFYYGKSLLELKNFKKVTVFFAAVLTITTIWCTAYISGPMSWALKPRITNQWISPWYPESADRFLKKTNIAPPMYNFYTWGGFLIWDIYPKYKVFIDGRALNNSVNNVADSILKSYPGWQGYLDAFHINFILVPVVFRESGYVVPLPVSLINDPQWKLVFLKNNQAVFVRNASGNRDIIQKYGMDKKDVLKEIVEVENILGFAGGNPIFVINKADALEALGYTQQAQQLYSMYPSWVRDKISTLFNYYPRNAASPSPAGG